jgi:TetR/AcrR family transcriptional regulator, regulator of cefoperazone and chloramphenicol sensitivity
MIGDRFQLATPSPPRDNPRLTNSNKCLKLLFEMSARSMPALRTPRRSPAPAASDPTREKLLDAAGRVFADRGYEAATVREICRRAGANVAAVNYHFRDKQGLYAQVLLRMAGEARIEGMRAALNESGAPEEIFRRVIKARMQGLGTHRPPDWHFRIVAREFSHPTPAMSRMIDKVSRPLYERMLDLIGKIIQLPVDNEKTRLCTYSVMGQIILYALASPILMKLWSGLKMTSTQMDRIADHIADFSLAYLREIRYGQSQSQPLSK